VQLVEPSPFSFSLETLEDSIRLERVLREIKTLITVSGEIESSALEIETVGRFRCLEIFLAATVTEVGTLF
jgi:hypothetical protein